MRKKLDSLQLYEQLYRQLNEELRGQLYEQLDWELGIQLYGQFSGQLRPLRDQLELFELQLEQLIHTHSEFN